MASGRARTLRPRSRRVTVLPSVVGNRHREVQMSRAAPHSKRYFWIRTSNALPVTMRGRQSFSSEEFLRCRRGRGRKDLDLPVSRRHRELLAIRTENKLAASLRTRPRLQVPANDKAFPIEFEYSWVRCLLDSTFRA